MEETYMGDTDKSEEDIEWGSDENDDHLKRLDLGLIIGAGVVVHSIEIGLSYSLGLANISASTDEGGKIHNRVFSITAGYKLGEL